MTSATNRLRALLDERGVEYRVSATGYSIDIGPNVTAYANRTDTTLDVSLRGFTPEQAVAATLGPGTCRDVAEFRGFGTKTEFRCSECGYEYSAVGGFGCDYGDEPDFRYCPNCGAKIEKEE